MQNPELAAAYERIEELEAALATVRTALRDGTEPFDIIEHGVEMIDRALDERAAA